MNSHFSEVTTAGILFSSNAIADTPQDKHKQLFFGNGVYSRIKKGELLEISK
ncbi:hypothetical protein [Lactobacillus taiwanensis]|uniref:hypothetical protein n=1 Tax=Lactobacillus taiwanensis TaxID=508451 RepID=UPI0015C5CFD9|nr:hypothetical protein [Lactobacillus taiwanensis]